MSSISEHQKLVWCSDANVQLCKGWFETQLYFELKLSFAIQKQD